MFQRIWYILEVTLDHSKILVFLKDQSAACSGNVWSSVVDVNNGSEYVYYYVCQYIYKNPQYSLIIYINCQVKVYFYCYRWPWMKLRILTTGGVPKIDTVTSIILWPNKCLEFSILFPMHWLQNLIPGNLGNHTFYPKPFGRPSLHLSSCSAFLPESHWRIQHTLQIQSTKHM